MYGHNLQELRALLPSGAGPSKADFINPVLRNGIEDINLINFAVHYLECLQKCDEEGENPWLLSLRDAARKRWQVQVSINAKLLRMYKEAPYKTIIHDCYGHCPAAVYQKDKHGQRRKPVSIDFCYKNEVGLYSRVWGVVSEGTCLWYLPWINKFNKLMLYDWDFDIWVETDVSWGAEVWDLNPDGTFIHCEKRPEPFSTPSWVDPEQTALVRTIGCSKYYGIVGNIIQCS